MANPQKNDSAVGKRLLNAKETAEYLGLKEWTVRQWASMGKLPKVKLGKALRFDRLDLERFVEENKSLVRTF